MPSKILTDEAKAFIRDRDAAAKALDAYAFRPTILTGVQPGRYRDEILDRRKVARVRATRVMHALIARGWSKPSLV